MRVKFPLSPFTALLLSITSSAKRQPAISTVSQPSGLPIGCKDLLNLETNALTAASNARNKIILYHSERRKIDWVLFTKRTHSLRTAAALWNNSQQTTVFLSKFPVQPLKAQDSCIQKDLNPKSFPMYWMIKGLTLQHAAWVVQTRYMYAICTHGVAVRWDTNI